MKTKAILSFPITLFLTLSLLIPSPSFAQGDGGKKKKKKVQTEQTASSRKPFKKPAKSTSSNWRKKYKSVEHYAYDYYFVNDGKMYGISKEGILVVPCIYDEIKNPNNEIGWNLQVRKGNKWGVLCESEPLYSGIGSYAQRRDFGKYEMSKLTKRSNAFAPIISCDKDSIIFSDSFITLYVLNDITYAQLAGSSIKIQLPDSFEFDKKGFGAIEYGENGVAFKDNGKWGYLGYNGMLPFEYSWIMCRGNGLIEIGMNGTKALASDDGSILIPFGKYSWLIPEDNNKNCIKATLKKTGKEGVINIKEEILLPFEYDLILIYGDIALCEIGNKRGIVNWRNNKIIEPIKYNDNDLKWESGQGYIVTNNGVTYVIDKHGNRKQI